MFFFVDDFKSILSVSQLFYRFLNILLAETFNGKQSLTGLFRCLFGILDGNNIGLLKTPGDELIYYVLFVGKLYEVAIFVPF